MANRRATLYVERAGNPQAPAIVFFHGAGLSSKQWQPQLAVLKDSFYCIAPDLPEQGRTPGPFDLSESARQIVALIRAEASQGMATLVGLSLGGAVVLEVLRTAPDVASRALVTGTSGKLSKTLGKIMVWSAAMTRFMPAGWLVNTAIRQFRIMPHRDLVYDDLLRGLAPDFNRRLAYGLMALDLPLQNAVPLLVLVGERETGAAKSAATTLTRTIPKAQGFRVPSVGHVWNLEAAPLFNDTLRAWASGQALPAALQPLR